MSEQEKIYKRRKLERLKSSEPVFAQIAAHAPLSKWLEYCAARGLDRVILCGNATDDMTREYCNEPLSEWEFARKFIYKYRSPVYRRLSDGYEVSVKLASESWFDKLEDREIAQAAWVALKEEWARTGLPLMSTPATTGMALLWQTLPFGDGARALPDELARHVRRISPQHRKEKFATHYTIDNAGMRETELFCYDGRFMYAAQCLKDRYPVGAPRKVGGFCEYQPGFYQVIMGVPAGWKHIGLIPVPDYERAEKFSTLGWQYPNFPGEQIGPVWVAEPELTFALKNGWHLLEVCDGWTWDKGRPLDIWAKKLIEMRENFRELSKAHVQSGPIRENHYEYAAAAVREILTNTIGRIHKNTVEREAIVNHAEWRELIRKWGYADVRTVEAPDEREDGLRLVEHPEPNPSDFMIFLPHVSATLYSLARVEVLKYALKINWHHLIEIDGDAIYTSERQQWIEEEDKQKIGQLRRKA
jgi:hypothetical protein